MKKFSVFFICLFTSFVLTACGKPKFDGLWEICTSDGTQLGYKISFGNDGQVKIDGINEEYEVVDNDTIKISGDNLDFKVIDKDKKLVYISDISESAQKRCLDSTAENLMKSINAVLLDMDTEGIFFSDPAVICSDENRNINAVPENAESDFDITESIRNYFSEIDEYQYIFFIKRAACYGVVCTYKSDNDVVGLCNDSFLVNTDSSINPAEFNSISNMNFDDIYEYYKSQILTENMD